MISYTEESIGVHAVSLYEPGECKAIVDYVRKLSRWDVAEVRVSEQQGEHHGEVVLKDRAASILPLAESARIHRKFHKKLDEVIKPLVKQIWRADFNEHSDTHLIRYLPDGYYHVHRDNSLDLTSRYFTVLCYLNDDFEGGQTRFPSLNHSVKPAPGKAIIFPSKYFHQGEPVLIGEKYILVSWLIGPAPIDWI